MEFVMKMNKRSEASPGSHVCCDYCLRHNRFHGTRNKHGKSEQITTFLELKSVCI